MPRISVNILTKNRSQLLKLALDSVFAQSFKDFEVVLVDDGSTDDTQNVLEKFKDLKIINHQTSAGITKSRQEALNQSQGEYVAILDDDDEWVNVDKLKKQVEFLDTHPEYILAGGGINIVTSDKLQVTSYFRPEEDQQIRNTMLFRNNFFTSTVMFKKSAAIKAGGFISDGADLSEDYDLWLRLGNIGKMACPGALQKLFRSHEML